MVNNDQVNSLMDENFRHEHKEGKYKILSNFYWAVDKVIVLFRCLDIHQATNNIDSNYVVSSGTLGWLDQPGVPYSA